MKIDPKDKVARMLSMRLKVKDKPPDWGTPTPEDIILYAIIPNCVPETQEIVKEMAVAKWATVSGGGKELQNTKQKEIKIGKAERWASRGCTSILHAIVSKNSI